jgi:uncharacterized protein (TIGR00369 family)
MDGGGDEIIDSSVLVEDGEWKGWRTWKGGDPFEDQSGPFYYRLEEDGSILCGFRAERKHMNGGGFMHGGCMLTFADFSLFAIARKELQGVHSVTVSLNGEFVGPAHIGDLVLARGEVVRGGKSLVFIRGVVSNDAGPMLSYSGVVKKVKNRL